MWRLRSQNEAIDAARHSRQSVNRRVPPGSPVTSTLHGVSIPLTTDQPPPAARTSAGSSPRRSSKDGGFAVNLHGLPLPWKVISIGALTILPTSVRRPRKRRERHERRQARCSAADKR